MAGARTRTPAASPKRPGAKDAPEFVGGDHVAEVQRHRPEGGADDGGEERARDEGQHVEHAIELAPPAGQAAQDQGRDHERQRVPHRLAEDGPERRRVIPEPEIADDDARPEPNAIQKQHGKSESRRRPQGRHRTVEIGKLEADPSRQVIAHGNQRNGNSVKHDTAVPGPAQRRKPSAHAVVAPVSPRSKRCRHALLEPSLILPDRPRQPTSLRSAGQVRHRREVGSRGMPATAVEHEHRVTPRELFFDLVFVFAFTQVATLLADDPTFAGIGRGVLVLAALWWAWTAYAWLTNTVDPEEERRRRRAARRADRDVRRGARGAGRVRRRGRALRRRLPRRLRDAPRALRPGRPREPRPARRPCSGWRRGRCSARP